MANDLTDRQLRVYAMLLKASEEGEPLPTLREMATRMRLRSPNTVLSHVKALERKGYVKRTGQARRLTLRKRVALDALANTPAETTATATRLALVVDNDRTLTWDFPRQVLAGIMNQAAQQECSLHTFLLNDTPVEALEREIEAAECRGTLLYSARAPQERFAALVRRLPHCVSIIRSGLGAAANFVRSDDLGGARTAVGYLLDSGRKRVAHIARFEFLEAAEARMAGWESAHRLREMEPDRALLCNISRQDLKQWMQENGPSRTGMDAVFAFDDGVARVVIDRLQDQGVRVPDDVAVIGVNDGATAIQRAPHLTTLRNDGYQLGAIAAERALGMMREGGRDHPMGIALPMALVRRDSA